MAWYIFVGVLFAFGTNKDNKTLLNDKDEESTFYLPNIPNMVEPLPLIAA